MIGARFEGLFLLILAVGLFMVRQRFVYALLLLTLGAVPVMIVGIPSMLHGGWILPNSVMLKGNRPSGGVVESLSRLAISAVTNLRLSPALALMTILAFLALYLCADGKNLWRLPSVQVALFLGMLLAHLAFAQVGNPFRYEAYLVVTGIYVLASCLKEPWCEELMARLRTWSTRSAFALAVLVLVVASPLVRRGLDATFRAARASHNCFEQQYQMARFAQRFYQGQAMVLNDIGFVSYLADIRLIDVVGLGSTDIARRSPKLDSETLGAISRKAGARIAMVYPNWLPGVPRGWIKIADWELKDKPYALGGRTIAFYATDPAEVEQLKAHLDQFDHELPTEVVAHLVNSSDLDRLTARNDLR